MGGVQRTLVRAFVDWAAHRGMIQLEAPEFHPDRSEEIDTIVRTFLADEGKRIWANK